MDRNAWYPGLAAVLRAVLCWCSGLWILTTAEQQTLAGIHVGAYLIFGAVCYGFFSLFLRQPRSVPVLAAAGGVMTAAGSGILLWKFSTLTGFGFHVLAVLSVAAVVLRSVYSCLKPIPAANSISALELTTLFLLFFLFVQNVSGWAFSYSLPLLAASALSVSIVIFQRLSDVDSSGHRRARGAAAVLLMLTAIALLLVLFMRYGAGTLGQGALTLYYGAIYCLKLLWHLLERFLFWLASLFPPSSDTGALAPPAEVTLPEGMSETLQLPPWVLILAGLIGLCLALAALVYVLFRLRSLRLGGWTIRTALPVQRTRLTLAQWFRRLRHRLRSRFRLLYFSITQRGTPQELYLYLQRAGRRMECGLLSGETPCAFVRRLSAVSDAPDFAPAMESLAQALGVCLYAQSAPPAFPGETARYIRRSIGKSLRRFRWTQLRRHLTRRRARPKQTDAAAL